MLRQVSSAGCFFAGNSNKYFKYYVSSVIFYCNFLFLRTIFIIHCWIILLSSLYFSLCFNAFIIDYNPFFILNYLNPSLIFISLLININNCLYFLHCNDFNPSKAVSNIYYEYFGLFVHKWVNNLHILLIINLFLHSYKSLYTLVDGKYKSSIYYGIIISINFLFFDSA